MQAKPVVGTHVYRRRARSAIGPIDAQEIVGRNERRAHLVAAIGGLVLARIDQARVPTDRGLLGEFMNPLASEA
jgi:hypothetical protein